MVTSYLSAVWQLNCLRNRPFKSSPEFHLFSQPVLVALDTGHGVVYAQASGWDRVCLFWTFRNFRNLPQNVLSPRQQQLIGSLYRAASNGHTHELYDAVVVGTVEDFRPSSLATLPTGTRGKKSARVHDHKPFLPRITFNRVTLKVGTVALVVAIAIFAWHKLRAQPVADSRSTQPVAAAPLTDQPSATVKDVSVRDLGPAIVRTPPNSVALSPSAILIPGTQSMPAQSVHTIATAEVTARGLAKTPGISSKRQPIAGATDIANAQHPVAAPPVRYEAAANQPRMLISGRPRKLVYPVCPETHARGKVSLQAVVGYDGAVNRIRVLTGGRALAAAAVEAVRQWRYEPFSGVPRLEREINITISFISNEVVAVSFPISAPLSR